jgi:threonine dehydrogenase-like Zn-dependent dehydrogenase
MQKGLINISDLITQNVPLHDAIAGFEMASDRDPR